MNILITGGASGLGESVTRLLASGEENQIWFTYHRSADKAKALEKEFKNVQSVHCDFSDPVSLAKLLGQMASCGLSALVNNALPGHSVQHFHKTEASQLAASFQLNVMPQVLIMQKAVELFRKKKEGKIVTILSSALINKPPLGWSAYVAEKAYIHSMCKSIAVENAAFNITCNCISPAFMQTALHNDTDERIIEDMRSRHPLKKLLDTQEVAEIVKFLLASTQQLNGSNIVVNAASDIS